MTNRLLGWREGEEEERSVKKKWIALGKKEGVDGVPRLYGALGLERRLCG